MGPTKGMTKKFSGYCQKENPLYKKVQGAPDGGGVTGVVNRISELCRSLVR